MDVPEHWIEHRRGDRELIGWIVPEGDDFVPVDLLGRRSEPVDWLSAEEQLDELGIGYLADRFTYRPATGPGVRVKIIEVSPKGILVQEDAYGDAIGGVPQPLHRLSWPIPHELTPL